MKHFRLFRFFVLFALIFNGISCSEQLEVDPDVALNMNEANIAALVCEEINQPEYMPLNVIPDWAKQKMTDEEYALWTIMSSVYEIDYSFLSQELDICQKEIIYKAVRSICHEIMLGGIMGPAGYFAVYRPSDDIGNVEQLTRSEMPSAGTFVVGPNTIYSVSGSDARVLVTAICDIKDSKIIAARGATAYASGRTAISFTGAAVVSSFSSYSITINCAGTLKYRYIDSDYDMVDFNSSVTVVPFL